MVDRNKSAHPKLEQALNGNRYVGLDQYQLYRPPKFGIRDPVNSVVLKIFVSIAHRYVLYLN
jgi:hypothetical protein